MCGLKMKINDSINVAWRRVLYWCAVAFAVLLSSASASESVGSGDWSDVDWSNGEPTALMDAFIRQETQVVTVRKQGQVAHRLVVGQHASHSTLNITSGSLDLGSAGSEELKGHLYVAWSGVGEVTGIINLRGGALTANWYDTMTNSAGDVAQLNISGNGTFNLNGNLNVGGGHADAEDRVSITGSRASIEVSNSVLFEANSTLKFTLDMYGVSTLNANSFSADPAAKLVIDFGTYVYSGSGTDVVRLVDANIFATPFDTANISYLNATELSYKLTQDPEGSGDIYVSIPEPSSNAWLGGLAVWVCGMRTRLAMRRSRSVSI